MKTLPILLVLAGAGLVGYHFYQKSNPTEAQSRANLISQIQAKWGPVDDVKKFDAFNDATLQYILTNGYGT